MTDTLIVSVGLKWFKQLKKNIVSNYQTTAWSHEKTWDLTFWQDVIHKYSSEKFLKSFFDFSKFCRKLWVIKCIPIGIILFSGPNPRNDILKKIILVELHSWAVLEILWPEKELKKPIKMRLMTGSMVDWYFMNITNNKACCQSMSSVWLLWSPGSLLIYIQGLWCQGHFTQDLYWQHSWPYSHIVTYKCLSGTAWHRI